MANKTNVRDLMIIANDSNFQSRIKYAMTNAGLAVMAEDGATPSHALRVTYAKTILGGTAKVFEMAVSVLNNASIATEADITQPDSGGYAIPDGDIQFSVNSDFNAMAGVAN